LIRIGRIYSNIFHFSFVYCSFSVFVLWKICNVHIFTCSFYIYFFKELSKIFFWFFHESKKVNDSNRFCYICGKYVLSKNLLSITDSLKERYYDYFHRGIAYQDKSWILHKSCKSCVETLRSYRILINQNISISVYRWSGKNQKITMSTTSTYAMYLVTIIRIKIL